MDKYIVKMTDQALRDVEQIFEYVAESLLEPDIAKSLIDLISEKIISLEDQPHRCPERRVGIYAGKGYRQLLIRNYTIIYRIDESQKTVVIVTVRYSRSDF